MANYVNWMKYSQPIKGDLLQIEGTPVSNHETPASGVASGAAPAGAQYASVWSDVAVTVEAANLDGETSTYTYALPANTPLQIGNVVVGSTTIEMTTI